MTESRQLGVPDRIDVVGRDNRLLTHQGAAATFDADGNLLSVASGLTPDAYSYDARNRLTSAGSLSYGYNAEDRRTAVTDASGTTRYTVNPNAVLDQVLVRTTPDGTKTFYVYGLGLLHEETSGTPRYYHHDRRGDTVALTDGAGAVTDRASYGVYGELLSRTGATNTPFLFNGRWGVQTDGDGLYYHRARYYHPQLRRFLNQDTVLGSITTSASLNRFAYANGNPVTAIDPFGLAAVDQAPNSGGIDLRTPQQRAADESYAREVAMGRGATGQLALGPMDRPNAGNTSLGGDALTAGNSVDGLVGLGLFLGGKTTQDPAARVLIDRLGRRVGYAGVAFAIAGIANEGFTVRTTADLVFAGAGLIPSPYTEIPAAIYTVATVYYDLEKLRSPPPQPSQTSPRNP